jgi:hypothetical protein
MSKHEIQALGSIGAVIADAEAADKADLYQHLGLKLTYNPGKGTLGTEIVLDAQSWSSGVSPEGRKTETPRAIRGVLVRVRGGT